VVVGGIDDDDLGRVADEPDVVLDFPFLPIENEHPRSRHKLDHGGLVAPRRCSGVHAGRLITPVTSVTSVTSVITSLTSVTPAGR